MKNKFSIPGWTTLACVAVLFGAIIAAFRVPPSKNTFINPAAILTFITGAAIAIERIIEMGWTVFAMFGKSSWPRKKPIEEIESEVNMLPSNLSESFNEFINRLSTKVEQFGEKKQKAVTELKEIKSNLQQLMKFDDISVQIKKWNTFATDNKLSAKYDLASATFNSFTSLLTTFKDNPERRFISITVGVCLGLLTSAYFDLDMFNTVLQTDAPEINVSARKNIQVVLTGVVIGLGASPTHELIRALQEYKKSKKLI